MEHFTKILNIVYPLIIFAKRSILDTWLACEYTFVTLYLFLVGKIDCAASEALAKMQEKIPIVKQTPQEVFIISYFCVEFLY